MNVISENLRKKITFALFFLMGVFASVTVFAQADATMIIANPGENSDNEMRISWHTNVGVVGSFVEYTKKSDTSWTNKKTVVGTYKLSTTWNGVDSRGAAGATFTQNIQVYKYGAVLSNLDPDTEYMYRVGLSTMSDTRYFKTAGAKEYSFGWISDIHATANNWLSGRLTAATGMMSRLITAAGTGGVNFMFSTGDDVAYGAGYDYWKDLFSHAHYKNYMWVMALGNHDAHTTAATAATDSHEFFRDTHNYPQNGYAGQEGCTYWFKYGDVLWVILNSMDLSTAQVPKAQAWLKQVIQNNPAQYVIVAEHYQYFDGITGNTNTEFTRWNQIFDECGVDLALAGNNHIYLRTKSLFNGAVNTDPTKGTVYIQAPSSDNDRGQAMNATLSSNADKIVYRWTEGGPTVGGILVTVNEEKIRVRLYNRSGTLLDDADVPTKRPVSSVLPRVSGVNAGALTAVDIKQPVTLNFNKKMDKTSVESAISLSPVATVSYTWASDYAVSIDISNLSYSTTYALTINGSVAKSTEGEFLDGANNGTQGSNYVLNFTTADPKKEANIFASELKVSPVATNGDVTFTYTLNAPASEVVITVSNGDEFTINSGTGLAKGINSVTKTLNTSTAQGDYAWSVKATGIPIHTNTGTTPIKFTDDNLNEMKYYSPRGGLAMDKNMDSPFFGRIYISESLGGTTAGRTTQDGIYVLNAALQDVTGQGNTSHKGGTSWTYNGTTYDLTPYRVSVAPDGKVLIPKNHATNPGIWIMDPANPSANFTVAFGSSSIFGRPIQSHLINDDLYLFDETYPAAYNILRFDNFSPNRTTAHNSLAFTNPSSIITPNASTGNAIAGFVPDGKGGFWIGQLRNTESAANPSLIHINSSGTIDFNSFSDMAANKIGAISKGVVAFNEEKDLIAVGCSTLVKIYEVVWTSGIPSLKTTTAPVSFNPTVGTNVDGLEFDPANNLYAISSSSEIIAGFSLPNANATANTFTTTAPASNPVVVGGVGIRDVATPNIRVACRDNQITVTSNILIQSVKLYDLQGRTIDFRQRVADNICRLNAPNAGIFIVETLTQNNRNVQKIVVTR